MQCHNVHHALKIISRFKGHLLDDDLNVAVFAACRLCFPHFLPVVDSGKDTGEQEVVFVLPKIEEESFDALLTPIGSVPLLKLTSAKSVECDAKRRKVTVTIGKDGHEDHITATVQVGESGRARSKTFVDMLFSMIDSTLPGVPRTCRDKRVIDNVDSEAFMFATCGTLSIVATKW